jgi:hypothetical protein
VALLPLLAQPEIKASTPGTRFSLDRRSRGVLTNVPGGLQIQALNRDPLIVSGTEMPDIRHRCPK